MVYFVPGFIAIGVLLFLTRLRQVERTAASDFLMAGVAGALALTAFLVARMPSLSSWEGVASLYGLCIGCALGAINALLPDYREYRGAIGLSTALLGIAAIQTPSVVDSRGMILGLLGGVGLVRLLFGGERTDGLVMGTFVLGMTHLFAKEVVSSATAEPIRLSVAMALVWLLVSVGESFVTEKNRSLVRIGGGVAAVMLVLFLSRNMLGLQNLWQPGLVGLGGAALVAWFIPRQEGRSGAYVSAAALLWLGLCTVAAGFDRALGLPVMLFAAATMFVCLERPGLLVTLAPVVAMIIFRAMRLADPEALRTIDLGQNYAVVGLIAGFLLVQLGSAWPAAMPRVSRTLAGVVIAVLIAASLVLMGGKGSVGLMLGAALAAAMILREEHKGGAAIAASIAVAGLTMGLHSGLMPYAGFDKAAKLQLLIKLFVVAGAFAIASAALARSKQGEPPIHETA